MSLRKEERSLSEVFFNIDSFDCVTLVKMDVEREWARFSDQSFDGRINSVNGERRG